MVSKKAQWSPIFHLKNCEFESFIIHDKSKQIYLDEAFGNANDVNIPATFYREQNTHCRMS